MLPLPGPTGRAGWELMHLMQTNCQQDSVAIINRDITHRKAATLCAPEKQQDRITMVLG